MNTVKAEPLSLAAFAPFGFYAELLAPAAEKFGAPPIEFFRDLVQQHLGGAHLVSFSVCRVAPRPPVIDVSECHSMTGETLLPLDSDVLIHVAPASADGRPPLARLRVFRVPRGTLVTLRPGVWHHAPFALGAPATVLVALPERTYANDCRVVSLEASECVGVEA